MNVSKNPKRDGLSFKSEGPGDAERLIKKFVKAFKSSGIPQELFRRKSYEKPSVKRKRKMLSARSK